MCLGNMRKYLIQIAVCLVFIVSSCVTYPGKPSPQLRIEEALDTIWIREEPNHGFYEINDTLTLYSSWPLFDNNRCAYMKHRSEPFHFFSSETYKCRISDTYPPFQVFKRANSDTLYLKKGSVIFHFKMSSFENSD